MHDYKRLTQFLIQLGVENVSHTQKTYMAHLVNLYRLMEAHGADLELCAAGMFHSIYGTEVFQGFKLPVERRQEVRDLIGERAERLAYWNCFMDRSSLDRAVERGKPPYVIRHRETGETVELSERDFNDLCRVHLFDWLEQAPRSRHGWGYRRQAYRRLAERLGGSALTLYDEVFAQEPAATH